MIFSTKKELKEVINVERRMNGKGLSSALVDSIFQRPAYLITKYLRHLRYLEFYQIRGGAKFPNCFGCIIIIIRPDCPINWVIRYHLEHVAKT